MTEREWSVRSLGEALNSGAVSPLGLAVEALSRSNRNRGRNTYLWQDRAWTLAEAERVAGMQSSDQARSPLWGLPVSVKDCFDLAGAPTSCGVRYYRDLRGDANRDSWLVAKLRSCGAVITGKTHLHPLAYGITGENPEFGDCEQPGNDGALTGGSSSGAAASVLEGSAVAAVGTDTGGSIRVPAALCGLAGYRASHGRGDWSGAAHLAESFDTLGWIFRDLQDGPLLSSVFAGTGASRIRQFTRFATVPDSFLEDCEPRIVDEFHTEAERLMKLGLKRTEIDVDWWNGCFDIFAPIQAWEAARIHAGHFAHFETSIRERLGWGARISDDEIIVLRNRYAAFRSRMDALFAEHELVLMPASPTVKLAAGADHSQTRRRLLRYTVPFSLGGIPVVTIPCTAGGMQLAAAREDDESLLAFAARLPERS